MKKQIKFYFHHDQFDEVDFKAQRDGSWFKRFLIFLGDVIFNGCYFIGLALINVVLLPVRFVKVMKDFPRSISNLQNKIPQLRRSLSIFASLAIIVGIVISSAGLVASGQRLKGRVLGASDSGLSYLNEAKEALEQQDTSRAGLNFTQALEKFESSQHEFDSTSLVLKGLLSLVPQKQDADNLLEVAKLMTEAGQNATQAYALTEKLKISQDGIIGDGTAETSLKQLQNLINTSSEKVLLAGQLMNKIDPGILPSDKQPLFLTARDSLASMTATLQTMRDGTSLLFDIVLGQKNLLLVFQNNNELRPTGGFMGTIGSAVLNNGKIEHLDIRSVYDFDGQLQDLILPPQPMFIANNRWYLRDSNWFGDFPTSASRMIVMFEKEGGETPDMVMALTPDLIIDLLRRTGPLAMPQYGVTLTADNFIETTQTATSITYDKQINQPKQILADFFPMLLQQLSKEENGGLIGVMEILQTSLYQKNVLLYSRNADLENKINSFNWGGQVRSTDRDYLNVISSNLGGTKTDRSLIKKVNLQSHIDSNGTVTNSLTYTVTNPLPAQNGLENNSFVRFLVPKGSKLKSAVGFEDVQLPHFSTNGYQKDSAISEWESTLSRDFNSGTYIGEESGKTMFGNWLKVKGGETKTATVEYRLPFTLKQFDRLSLLIQKQSGSNLSFNYQVNLNGRESLWQNFNPNRKDGDISYQTDLTKDIFLGQVIADK